MKRFWVVVFALLCISTMIAAAAATEISRLTAKLVGIEETPLTLVTNASGTFNATVNDDATITYTLTYKNLSAPVTQAHIHIGATKITGGVAIFLCGTAVSPGPAGTPTCPQSGTVTRTVSAADVIGPTGQGVTAGDMADVVRAIASHVAYANVHTTSHPGGEIRGQIRQHGDDEDDELPGAR
jgi:hypothetical protein